MSTIKTYTKDSKKMFNGIAGNINTNKEISGTYETYTYLLN
ncbi:MAG: hypothetical protein FD169_720 [Bacillota bacterium]|nr:MAG: hypothetical protein FD169_720 [Bacillota bacterium]